MSAAQMMIIKVCIIFFVLSFEVTTGITLLIQTKRVDTRFEFGKTFLQLIWYAPLHLCFYGGVSANEGHCIVRLLPRWSLHYSDSSVKEYIVI